MGKHTPGKWTVHGAKVQKVYVEEEGVELGGIVNIATVHDAQGDRDANLRLIAAAPELYEALRMLSAVEDFSQEVKPGDVITMPEDVAYINKAYALARKALRKAEAGE